MSDDPVSRKPQPPAGTMTIKIKDELQPGVYSNKAIIAHSRDEFVFDFLADFPPGPALVARIVTAPAHAAAFLEALRDNIARYEAQHERIRRPPSGPHAPPANA